MILIHALNKCWFTILIKNVYLHSGINYNCWTSMHICFMISVYASDWNIFGLLSSMHWIAPTINARWDQKKQTKMEHACQK